MSNFNTILSCANNTLLATVTTGNIVNGAVTPVQTASVVPGGAFRNLKVVAAGGVKTETITADSIEVVTSSDATPFNCLAVSHTLNMANSGVDGIDTGAVAASTQYFTYEIYNGTACHSLASLSSTVPTMPAGYSYKARDGAFFTDGASNIIAGTQQGRTFQYKVPPLLVSGAGGSVYSPTSPTWAAESLTATVPSTAAKYSIVLENQYGAATNANAIGAPNNNYGGVQSTSPPPPPCGIEQNSAAGDFICNVVAESTNFYYASNNLGGAALVFGWEDNL